MLLGQAVFEENGEVVEGRFPFRNEHRPLSSRLSGSLVGDLQNRVLVRVVLAVMSQLPNHAVDRIQWRWSSSRSADRPREVEQPNNNDVEPLRVSVPKSSHLEIRHIADEGVMLAELVLHRERSPAGWLAHSRSFAEVRMCRFLDSLWTKVYGRLALRTHFVSLRYLVAVCLCSLLIISFPFHRLIRCSLLDSHSHLATESERAGNCGLRPCEVVGIPDVGWQNPKSPCSVIGYVCRTDLQSAFG